MWAKKNIEFDINLDPVEIISDENLLGNVWNNILSNAIKFSNQNGKIVIDLKVVNNNIEVSIKDYGSEGQQKNAIIAYKLCELEIFKQIRGEYPILILDDLFSELDRFKINNILNLINEDIQTFITTTEIDKINDNVLSNSKLFEVVDGEVREVNYEGRI